MGPDERVLASCFANTLTRHCQLFCGYLKCVCCNCRCLQKCASSICLTLKLPTNITVLIHHFSAWGTRPICHKINNAFLFCLCNMKHWLSCRPVAVIHSDWLGKDKGWQEHTGQHNKIMAIWGIVWLENLFKCCFSGWSLSGAQTTEQTLMSNPTVHLADIFII